MADAAVLAGLDDPLPALQEAIGQRLLTETSRADGRHCAFPHALIRAAAARSGFAVLGARPFLRRCDTELGTAPQAIPLPAGLPLTPRQLTVALAVAEGKTNRQVADELYVTTKTVEFHVSQILARLGIDSRTQIAGALGQRPAGPAERPAPLTPAGLAGPGDPGDPQVIA